MPKFDHHGGRSFISAPQCPYLQRDLELILVTTAIMPGRVSTSQKRALADNTNAHNVIKSPPSAKKRKLNGTQPNVSFNSSQGGPNGFKNKFGSSQPKSQFETEVLEKMTQDISGLKENNAEKDQQWDRPSLDDFNAKRDLLRFQSIDIEEGVLHGGKVTLKMFGVSEVSRALMLLIIAILIRGADWSLDTLACDRLPPLPLCRSTGQLSETRC